MKSNRFFAILALAIVMLVSGCKKEGSFVQFMLTSENYHGDSKTIVTNTNTYWVDGDMIKLNGIEYAVHVNEFNKVYVNVSEDSAVLSPIYAYTPSSIVTSVNGRTESPVVTIPSVYESSFNSNGQQVLGIPMASKVVNSGLGTSISFVHLTGAIKVRLLNNVGSNIIIDSVVITSTSSQLCGNKQLTWGIDGISVSPSTTESAFDRRVKVTFPTNSISLANGSTKDIFVPILPISGDESISFQVFTHKLVDHSSDNSGLLSVNYDYNNSLTLSAPAISRGQYATAQIAINQNTTVGHTVTKVDHSLFTINSDGRRVRFSKGNLRAYATTQTTFTWSFHDHQYDYVGNDNANTFVDAYYKVQGSGVGHYVDLFGWNGHSSDRDSYGIDASSRTAQDYGNVAGESLKHDWREQVSSAWYTTWYTMSASEWDYLINERSVSVSAPVAGRRFLKATIGDSVKGLIIFPDNYSHPDGVDLVVTSTGFTSSVSMAGWEKMEAAGAVFLPVGGKRSIRGIMNYVGSGSQEIGFYWTGSSHSSDGQQAMCCKVSSSNPEINAQKRHIGMNVRLVQNAE